MVAIHGGGWQAGDRAYYKYWGPFLARNGYALFTIEYRLGKAGVYPAAVYDVKAAVQFVRARAAEFAIDPDRIGVMGDSAGGYLAAILALAGDQFTSAYRDDPNAGTPVNVKAVVGFYGIYDMLAQWKHDMLAQRKREMLAQRNHDLSRARTTTSRKSFSAFHRCRLCVSIVSHRRSAMPLSIATRYASCSSTAAATISSIRRPDGGLLCCTYAGRFFRAANNRPWRWPFLGIGPV